jgi:CubicO group peptidase (beta-lactamase class C family)
MSSGQGRRRILGAALCGAAAACGGSDSADGNNSGNPNAPVPGSQIDAAIAGLDTLANSLMTASGVLGMSVAVVRNLQTVYAKGFGTRLVGSGLPVDADTVFQLASLSKPVGSVVVAHQVGIGTVSWDTPVRAHFANRATGHVKRNGQWVVGLGSVPDAQAPAGGVSSSANDMANWLIMMLGEGVFNGNRIVDATALNAAISPQSQIQPAGNGQDASYYGFGFNVGTTEAGRAKYSHSGAFGVGAATNFVVVPVTGCAIVALTNGFPIGVPETLTAQFFDLVEFGSIQRDWLTLYGQAFASMNKPTGSLVGMTPPASPLPARSLSTYAGTYNNSYYGPIQVTEASGSLLLTIGGTPLRLPLSHWDGDTFTFTLVNENAAPGTISAVSFLSNQVTLEYYNAEGLGTFTR